MAKALWDDSDVAWDDQGYDWEGNVIYDLSAVDLDSGSPTLESPVLMVVYQFLSNDLISGAPDFGTPSLIHVHQLLADDLDSGVPDLGTPQIELDKYYVSQIYTANYTSFTSAASELSGKTFADKEVIIECLDTENYDEDSIDWTGVALTGSSWLHFIGVYSRDARTTISNTGLNLYIFKLDKKVEIEGIKFSCEEDFDCSTNDYGALYFDGPNTSYTSIHECQFYGNGRYYYQESPYVENGNYAIHWAGSPQNDEKYVYNNLFRMNGYYAVQLIHGVNTEFYNNDFVKNQEDFIWWSAVDSGAKVWNNIFVKDGDKQYVVDCNKHTVIQHPGGVPLPDWGLWDYNLYQFLNADELTQMNLWTENWDPATNKERLADAQSAWPSVEQNGIEGDPKFDEYCVDYHIGDETSPARDSAYLIAAKIDNDGVVRGYPDRGCYDNGAGESSPHWDQLQNATAWMKVEDTRSSGDERKARVNFEYVRIL